MEQGVRAGNSIKKTVSKNGPWRIASAPPFLKKFVHFLSADPPSLSTARSRFSNPDATLFLHQKNRRLIFIPSHDVHRESPY
jgi:hypothetical protein